MNTCKILCSPLIRKKDCVPMKMLQRKLCLAMEAGQVGKCLQLHGYHIVLPGIVYLLQSP